jgi:hypothetical protein
MKTREIEVWVSKDVLDHLIDEPESNLVGSTVFKRPTDHWSVKAKLIIEIPERKVEITESEFDAAAWGSISFNSLKEKLFAE